MTSQQVTAICGSPSIQTSIAPSHGGIAKWIYAGDHGKPPVDIIWFNAGKNTVRNARHFDD